MSASSQRQALSAAAHWFARLGAAPGDPAVQQQWQAWHNEHPLHQWAWQQLAQLQAQLGIAQGTLGYNVLERAGQRSGMARRSLLKGLLLAAGLGSMGWAGYRQSPIWLADLRTGVGEQRRQRLADGSTLILNTASAVDVAFSAAQRLITLRAGEILIETAKDPRPFLVHSAEGTLQALGTRFAVRQDPGSTRLSVFEHAVAVRPAQAVSGEQQVEEGSAVRFDRHGLLDSSPLAMAEDAWVEGRLVVDGWPLQRLVDELQRFRSGYLGCAQAVAHLQVSGAFPLHDIDRALAAIARALPVRIERHTALWTRLVARETTV